MYRHEENTHGGVSGTLEKARRSNKGSSKLTNIYHITYAKEPKLAVLFFWGCNFSCRGCYRKKNIYNVMLKETLGVSKEEPNGIARPPERFLEFEEVIQILETLDIKCVLMEGVEPSLDPQYSQLTETLHKKFGTYNILLTNTYQLPVLKHTDEVEVSIKAITDSLHRHYTGKSNRKVLQNFVKLYESGMKLIVESVVIPDYIDADETERIAKFIASVDKSIPYIILPYIKAGDNHWRRPTPEEMDQAASAARKHLSNVTCVHGDEELLYETLKIF